MPKDLNRILLVEDEPDIQEVARLALESFGKFEVHVCGGGAEALQKGPELQPDLILLDVMMPGMDGITTLKLLKEHKVLANIPVIFMTAKAQPSEMENYIKIGAIGAISKPFDPVTLPNEIRSIWNKYYEQ